MRKTNKVRSVFLLIIVLLVSCSGADDQDSINIQRRDNHPLNGKHLFTLFDSFGEHGIWQQYLTELTGCEFDQELNYNESLPLSYGGSSTLTGGCCGQQRALNLAKLKDTHTIDVLMIENVNDVNLMTSDTEVGGSMENPGWMLQQEVDLLATTTLYSADEAVMYWKSHFDEIISSIGQHKTGTLVHIPYERSNEGYRLTILNTPTQDGIIYLHVGGNRFGITVTREMSIDDIAHKILEYNYGGGWKDIRVSENEIVISYSGKIDKGVSIDVGKTGLRIEISPSMAYSTQNFFYTGADETQWADKKAWKSWISLYSQYKGLFGYLINELPDTQIYLFIPTYYYGAGKQKAKLLFDCQREVAEYYGIPVIDMTNSCGIDDSNYTQYYNEGDVHPKAEGYRLWAETICRLLEEHNEQ